MPKYLTARNIFVTVIVLWFVVAANDLRTAQQHLDGKFAALFLSGLGMIAFCWFASTRPWARAQRIALYHRWSHHMPPLGLAEETIRTAFDLHDRKMFTADMIDREAKQNGQQYIADKKWIEAEHRRPSEYRRVYFLCDIEMRRRFIAYVRDCFPHLDQLAGVDDVAIDAVLKNYFEYRWRVLLAAEAPQEEAVIAPVAVEFNTPNLRPWFELRKARITDAPLFKIELDAEAKKAHATIDESNISDAQKAELRAHVDEEHRILWVEYQRLQRRA